MGPRSAVTRSVSWEVNRTDQTADCNGQDDLLDLYVEYELRNDGLEVHRPPGRVS